MHAASCKKGLHTHTHPYHEGVHIAPWFIVHDFFLSLQFCDKIRLKVAFSFFGNLAMAVSMSSVGPLPFLPFPPSVAAIYTAAAVEGLAYGLNMV